MNPSHTAAAPDTSQQKRIIFITEIDELGGAERSCLALAHWLHTRGLPSCFLCYRNEANIAQYASFPLNVVALNPAMTVVGKVTALRRYMHSGPQKTFRPLASGYQPALHTTLAGVSGFHTLMHDTPKLFSDGAAQHKIKHRLRRSASNWIVGRGLRSGGQTIVTSEFLQRDCLEMFGVHAVIARMGGLGMASSFRPRPVGSRLSLLSVSRIEANKRIDWILRALAAMEHGGSRLSDRVDWQFDVAGKGSQLEQMKQLASSLDIAARVHFHGFVSDEQLAALYERAHLFLMPAVQGYGIPAIESISRGIPVLLHRDSGVSDILLDTPWATVIAGDEESLLPGLFTAIDSVLAGVPQATTSPALPTEDSWAEQVATLCGWV